LGYFYDFYDFLEIKIAIFGIDYRPLNYIMWKHLKRLPLKVSHGFKYINSNFWVLIAHGRTQRGEGFDGVSLKKNFS